MRPQVSIITPLFNRLDLTRAYLESLERTLRRWRYEVILVDDGSTDGTREFLRTLPPGRFRIVLNEVPQGYAANNNAAARLARAPLLCLLNNDLVLTPCWLEPMARLAQWSSGVAFVGNVQREPVGGLIDHFGVYFERRGITSEHDGLARHAGKNAPAAPPKPYLEWAAVTAACCVIRRRLFLKLGGFDEGFRNGFEDVDFCLRARKQGYRHFVANRSQVYHHVSASPGRKQYEEANVQRFRERWLGWITRESDRRCWNVRSSREPGGLTGLGLRCEDALYRWVSRFGPKKAPRVNTSGLEAPVLLVAGEAALRPHYDGATTVVRKLAGALGRINAPTRIVHWQSVARELCLLPPDFSLGLEAERLRETASSWARQASLPPLLAPSFTGPDSPFHLATPLHQLPAFDRPPKGSWVVLPAMLPGIETDALVDYAHRHGWRLAVVLHDALATNEPGFFPPGVPDAVACHLIAVSRADLLLPVSDFTANDWRLFTASKNLPSPPVVTCKLAANTFADARTTLPPRPAPDGTIRLLCVSAVAPRKGHLALLAAYELALAARPGLRLELRFVGERRPGAEDVEAAVHAAMKRHPGRIFWHERAEYATLRRFYEECDFTVYPSVLEGFGLPILESLWCRRPCVCANFGAMDETAWGGGCVVTDVREPQILADAVLSLATNPARRESLAVEIDARGLRQWEEYACDLLHLQKPLPNP